MVINLWIFSTIFHDNVTEWTLNRTLHKKKSYLPFARRNLHHIYEVYYDIWVWVKWFCLQHILCKSISISMFRCTFNWNRLIDNMDTVSFVCVFVVILCAAVAAAVELFICLKVCTFFEFSVLIFGYIFLLSSWWHQQKTLNSLSDWLHTSNFFCTDFSDPNQRFLYIWNYHWTMRTIRLKNVFFI